MFYPLPLFVGLRYVRSRSHGFFVSFISWISMLGICIGVAALIVIVSVMNGMEAEVRGRLLSLASHATLSAPPARMRDWQALAKRVRAETGVIGVAPYIEAPAMLSRGAQPIAMQLRGVSPQQENQVSEIGRLMKAGSLADLAPGTQQIVLGAGLAWQMDARIGDEVLVLVSQSGSGSDSVLSIAPRMRTFVVSGIFEVGLQEHDDVLALVHMDDAAELMGVEDAPTGLRLKFADIFAAPSSVARIAQELGQEFRASDWSIENASYFRAVRIERTMMSAILMLIVAVAAFNIVAALMMVVNEKRTDIAILRTLGLQPRGVLAAFLTQGVIIGWFGALLGLALGVTLAANVEPIMATVERLTGAYLFDPEIFYISKIPSQIHWEQVATIAGLALLLTLLATVYPSLRAARTEPAEALRYE